VHETLVSFPMQLKTALFNSLFNNNVIQIR